MFGCGQGVVSNEAAWLARLSAPPAAHAQSTDAVTMIAAIRTSHRFGVRIIEASRPLSFTDSQPDITRARPQQTSFHHVLDRVRHPADTARDGKQRERRFVG